MNGQKTVRIHVGNKITSLKKMDFTSNMMAIISTIVAVDELIIDKDPNGKRIETTNKVNDQAIIIQTTDDGFWVRLREPYTSYLCETLEELEMYMENLTTNKIEVCVAFKDGEWAETVITPIDKHDELTDDFDYTISSWSNPTRGEERI